MNLHQKQLYAAVVTKYIDDVHRIIGEGRHVPYDEIQASLHNLFVFVRYLIIRARQKKNIESHRCSIHGDGIMTINPGYILMNR